MLPAFILKMNDQGAKTLIIRGIRKIVFGLAVNGAVNILLNHADNGIPTTKFDRHPESPSMSQRFLQLASRGEGSCA